MSRLRPTYAHPSEQRAYLVGFADGSADRPMAHTYLATTWPNAYARGYWEGVADREEHGANTARIKRSV